jgi:hypothetical protein
VNGSERTIHTYLGVLGPGMQNATYCSAGQLSPLLNDPLYETIGIGTSVWLAGARGIVHAEGTQHAPTAERGANDVSTEGAGTLGLTAEADSYQLLIGGLGPVPASPQPAATTVLGGIGHSANASHQHSLVPAR